MITCFLKHYGSLDCSATIPILLQPETLYFTRDKFSLINLSFLLLNGIFSFYVSLPLKYQAPVTLYFLGAHVSLVYKAKSKRLFSPLIFATNKDEYKSAALKPEVGISPVMLFYSSLMKMIN